MAELEEAIATIGAKAQALGLDFFDMRFEMCPAEVLYTFGAYGMPTRFSHWSFGKAYQRMKTQYDYNLSRIYELVINSDPCYAFLLESNSLIQNKLVVAHVFAHSDFFKNNAWFRNTSRGMVESMASSAERIRRYEFAHGRQKVETFLDAAIALQEQVSPFTRSRPPKDTHSEHLGGNRPEKARQPETPYDDLWALGQPKEEETPVVKKFPEEPQEDLLLFAMEHAKHLEDWQRDIISIVREEMIYFLPQISTKIMNEGWASLWHARLMRELDLSNDEAIEFAAMHASVLQPSPMRINPYYVGMKIFEDIQKRWDDPSPEEREKYGRPGGEGLQKIFEVRETENDVSFLRNYLTRELVEELDLYLYRKVDDEWKIVEKNWEKVRDAIVASMTNYGFPRIVVEDADYNRAGELYLKHRYEDQELDVYYLEKTLPYVYALWGRPVFLETTIDHRQILFFYDGERNGRKAI